MSKIQVDTEDVNGVVRSLDYDHALSLFTAQAEKGKNNFKLTNNWKFENGSLYREQRSNSLPKGKDK